VAATFATMATMFALYERDQGGSGRGQEVDVSLYEPLFRLAEAQTIAYDQLKTVRNASATARPRIRRATRMRPAMAATSRFRPARKRASTGWRRDGDGGAVTRRAVTDAFRRQRNADELDALMATGSASTTATRRCARWKQARLSPADLHLEDIFKDPNIRRAKTSSPFPIRISARCACRARFRA